MSKGVDYYAFLNTLGFGIDFQFPTDSGKSKTTTYSHNSGLFMYHNNDQISESDIGILDHYGLYQWTVRQNLNAIASGNASIAPSTGNIDGSSSMANMMNTPSVINPQYCVSYGFYDSGPGFGSLTNQDQSYVYVSPNNTRWMGSLMNENPSFKNKPFASFALPAAHDSGMFDLTKVNSIINNATELATLIDVLGAAIGVGAEVLSPSILRSVINFSMTQKDNIKTMLSLGTRYFDFRPGNCLTGLSIDDNSLYHQHKFIPGYSYASFLNDILNFLLENPTEIVVVSTNFQGFLFSSMKPSIATINEYLINALRDTKAENDIVPGNKLDLSSSYSTLITNKKRLIFLNQIGASDDAQKYDSYSDDAYQTTNVSSIIDALNSMEKAKQANYDYTVLQLQGTANATGGGIFTSLATMSDASSPLISTKAMFDNQTYTWLSQHVAKNLAHDKLVIFLNDFTDNALTSYASSISAVRMTS